MENTLIHFDLMIAVLSVCVYVGKAGFWMAIWILVSEVSKLVREYRYKMEDEREQG